MWIYNCSNVVMLDDGVLFCYSFSVLKDCYNVVEVNWIDLNNGWEMVIEFVEDMQVIVCYGCNVMKMDVFGCISWGQVYCVGLWLIKIELLEMQIVDFSVGVEGFCYVLGDVIEICDDDYVGISIGGCVLVVNSQIWMLMFDCEIMLLFFGIVLISLVDGSGNLVSVEVQFVIDGVKVKVSCVFDGVVKYSVWELKLLMLCQ